MELGIARGVTLTDTGMELGQEGIQAWLHGHFYQKPGVPYHTIAIRVAFASSEVRQSINQSHPW
jgi:hypothetical protein